MYVTNVHHEATVGERNSATEGANLQKATRVATNLRMYRSDHCASALPSITWNGTRSGPTSGADLIKYGRPVRPMSRTRKRPSPLHSRRTVDTAFNGAATLPRRKRRGFPRYHTSQHGAFIAHTRRIFGPVAK